jgi:hypothetical protein
MKEQIEAIKAAVADQIANSKAIQDVQGHPCQVFG